MATLAEIDEEIARRQQQPSLVDIDAEIARRQPQGLLSQAGDAISDVADVGLGNIEAVATIASGALAEPVAGIAGLVSAPFVGAERAAEIVGDVQEAGTFTPRTEEGQQRLQQIGDLASVIPEVGEPFGNFILEQTGSPALAALAQTAPTALAEAMGLGSLRKLRVGTRLIDDAGRPTKELRNALDKQGLDFDSLTPEAKAVIPDVADQSFISGSPDIKTPSEDALVEQIKSGAKDDSLAGLAVIGNKIVNDKPAIEALRQGFEGGFIQSIKVASPDTKKAMQQMVNMTRRIKKQSSKVLDFRPTDVVGTSLMKRVVFIRDKANDARKQLDGIATAQLKGLEIDTNPILNQLDQSLSDLDITLLDGPGGKPVPVFKGSLISKDRRAQRAIKDVIDLMAEGGAPDALRAHKLKRQLDNMIDFNKKTDGGLSDAGRNVLKDIRRSLNNSVRDVHTGYAEVNDVLSQSLGALDDIQTSVGKSIDIFGSGGANALGQDLRGLLSNRKTRVKLDNAVKNIDTVASDLGASFGDDINDLVLFADGLEDTFGATARTSLKGEVESAIRQAGTQGPLATVKDKALEAAAKGTEKLRGINEFNQFESLNDLLRR